MNVDHDRDSEPNDFSDKSSSLEDEGSWSVFADPNKYELLGFLQMCIERRFHMAVQKCFQDVVRLEETAYWIHTGAGGSPKLEGQPDAPNYCYYKKEVRIMGWSAHGSNCGGFREGDDNDFILEALKKTLANQRKAFPLATHVGLFAREGDTGIEVLVLR